MLTHEGRWHVQGQSSKVVRTKPTHTRQPKVKGFEWTGCQSSEWTVADMTTPRSTPNSAPDGGTTPMPTTTGLPTNSTSQTLLALPALVTVVAQLTSSVERALDQHFTLLLRQQQQLVLVVQQLARPQAAVSLLSSLSNPPTGEGGIGYGV